MAAQFVEGFASIRVYLRPMLSAKVAYAARSHITRTFGCSARNDAGKSVAIRLSSNRLIAARFPSPLTSNSTWRDWSRSAIPNVSPCVGRCLLLATMACPIDDSEICHVRMRLKKLRGLVESDVAVDAQP